MDINSVWNKVSEEETIDAYNQAVDDSIKALKSFFKDDQPRSFDDF